MIGIVIVAHGKLAIEYLSVMEHIMGNTQAIATVSINPTDKLSDKECEIVQAINLVDTGLGVLVVTDMHGSTPANLALRACRGRYCRVLFGLNLPMLIKLVKVRHKHIEQAAEMAIKAGKKYINFLTPQD